MRINQKLVDGKKGLEYLIVDICQDLDQIAVTQLNVERPKRPHTIMLSDTLSQIELGKWKVLEHSFSPYLYMSDEELLKDKKRRKWLQRRDSSFNIIAPLIDNDELRYNYLFIDSSSILHRLIETSGRSRSYVAKILNRTGITVLTSMLYSLYGEIAERISLYLKYRHLTKTQS